MPIDEVLLVNQLIFVGLNGYVAALDRDTGEIVWSNDQLRGGYVTLMIDGDRLIVSTNGFMYCLDPCTGRILWHNPMTGYGYGVTSLASARGQNHGLTQAAAETGAAASTAVIAGSS
jgi:outer membrane protein assembly factor BamB